MTIASDVARITDMMRRNDDHLDEAFDQLRATCSEQYNDIITGVDIVKSHQECTHGWVRLKVRDAGIDREVLVKVLLGQDDKAMTFNVYNEATGLIFGWGFIRRARLYNIDESERRFVKRYAMLIVACVEATLDINARDALLAAARYHLAIINP